MSKSIFFGKDLLRLRATVLIYDCPAFLPLEKNTLFFGQQGIYEQLYISSEVY